MQNLFVLLFLSLHLFPSKHNVAWRNSWIRRTRRTEKGDGNADQRTYFSTSNLSEEVWVVLCCPTGIRFVSYCSNWSWIFLAKFYAEFYEELDSWTWTLASARPVGSDWMDQHRALHTHRQSRHSSVRETWCFLENWRCFPPFSGRWDSNSISHQK